MGEKDTLLPSPKSFFYERIILMENNNKDIFKNYPDVVTVEDLQNMLHIGRNTAYGILKDGAIKTIKIGKKYIIPKQSVIEFINVARI